MPTTKTTTTVILTGPDSRTTASESGGSIQSTTYTDKLSAVNTMLSIIGETPVSSLGGSKSTPEVVMAENILDEVHREVDSKGWHYNIEEDVELGRDTEDEILVPGGIIRLDIAQGAYPLMDIIVRGGKLYDKVKHTFIFTESIKVDAVYHRSWDDLPEPARRYMMIRAGRMLQDRIIGNVNQNSFTSRDEFMALADMREYEGDTADYTMLDSFAVSKALPSPTLPQIPR